MAESELPVAPDALDADPMLLNVANGTVNLRTGQLLPHRQEDLITKVAPVTVNSSTSCTLWLQFMNEITDGNQALINYHQRIAGLCLTGDISEQYLFILHGGGANGKSVYADTITGILGDYAGEAAPTLLMATRSEEHPTQTADLHGKRLVVASETEEGGRLKLQTVKRLTGDKTLKARFMRQDYFSFQRTHKLWMVTNNRPAVRENTHAVWRRIRLIPFEITIPEDRQDKHLVDKLREEWPGILNWMIAGCLEWQRSGLQAPEVVESATRRYQEEQDILAEFVQAVCILDGDLRTPRTEMYGTYKDWAAKAGDRHPLDRNTFYEHLRKGSVSRPALRDGPTTLVGHTGEKCKAKVFFGIGIDPRALIPDESDAASAVRYR
jgi:putative DNA primase/helicase